MTKRDVEAMFSTADLLYREYRAAAEELERLRQCGVKFRAAGRNDPSLNGRIGRQKQELRKRKEQYQAALTAAETAKAEYKASPRKSEGVPFSKVQNRGPKLSRA